MKKLFALLAVVSGIASTSGAIFQFDVGPLGLTGLNERPTPVVTTATGGELAPGITYNDDTKQLTLNYGWGDVNGFTDLQGSFSATHIHGSPTSDLNTAAGVLYNTGSFVNQQTSTDGVVSGVVTLNPNPNGTVYSIAAQEADLMNGRWYLNVHSALPLGTPSGEIRGQLLMVVPEPQTYATIAGLGLLGFAVWRRRHMAMPAK